MLQVAAPAIINPRRAAYDAARRDDAKTRELFTRARKVEAKYAAALRRIARHCGDIIKGFPAGDPAALPELNATLARYSEMLGPWAKFTSRKVVLEVARLDERAWSVYTKEMSASIREQLRSVDIGPRFRELQDEQIVLIKSIPVKAAQRVHELTMKSLSDSSRASSYIEEIMKSGHVARSHAELIALTEVSRAATSFTQARSEAVGSETYMWETVRDARVRPEHKKLQGKVCRWDSPPIAGLKGERAHPGAIYRCRCFPRPIIPD